MQLLVTVLDKAEKIDIDDRLTQSLVDYYSVYKLRPPTVFCRMLYPGATNRRPAR